MEVPKHANDLSCYFTWMGEDGIARTKVKQGAEVSLEHAQENSVVVNSLYRDKKFPLIVDARGIKSMTREARKHFSTEGRSTNVTSFAIIIGAPISKMIGNFFMGINKPAIPARLFTSEEEAKKWLLKINQNS